MHVHFRLRQDVLQSARREAVMRGNGDAKRTLGESDMRTALPHDRKAESLQGASS